LISFIYGKRSLIYYICECDMIFSFVDVSI